ncbi:PREDICTED: nuclear transition protein 2 [Hipposideros armiger]|uniref:Nuclear transition protein 2 n=1 Tax=Hipposideros armiger TaxID=186990 RepID=A0A8B7S469_HIPAR|nr:PREDICTED: nuclear transition protein 2 [Hipposideros armiger]
MDTKAQNIPITHTQPHCNSRSQSHTCNHCSCSHHCQNCSQSCSWSQGCSQSPTGHCSLSGHQSQSPRSSPLSQHQRHAMHSHHCPKQPATHSCRHPKNKKNLEGKVKKRKVIKRRRRVYKTKRRSSGTFRAGGEGPQGPPDEEELPSWTLGAVR